MDWTRVVETRLLPLALAFGCGVLTMQWAAGAREARALDMAERAINVAEIYAQACGIPLDALDEDAPEPASAPAHLVAEVQP